MAVAAAAECVDGWTAPPMRARANTLRFPSRPSIHTDECSWEEGREGGLGVGGCVVSAGARCVLLLICGAGIFASMSECGFLDDILKQ